jgi:hypothetical protein
MKLLFLVLCAVTGLYVNATTYYISQAGDDNNSGTSSSAPWKSINKINSRTFQPGDFILFRRGDTWREQLDVPSSGSAGNPITFSAYGSGAKPIINGADIIKGWSNYNGSIWSISHPNTKAKWAMVVIDDVIYAEVSNIGEVNSPNKYFINRSTTPATIYVYSATNPDYGKAEVSKRDYGIKAWSYKQIRYVNFVNLEVRYAGTHGLMLEGPVAGFCVVDSCHFYANRATGCDAHDQHTNDTFKNSTATYNGNGFYSWISDNLTISKCTTSHSIPYANTSLFTDGHAFGNYKGNNWVVEYCYSNDDADAIHIDAGGVAANATIRYNKVFNSKSGSPNTPGMGVGSLSSGATIKIYYNLIVNCASSGFESYTASTGKILFYNNTILLNRNNGVDGGIYLNYGSNFVFKNNITVRDYVPYKQVFTILRPGISTNDYNQYFIFNSPDNTVRLSYNGTIYNSLAEWTKATGQDAHSISSDPLFVNKTSDWTLQAASPCINKGVDVGLTEDIAGNPIVGLPDLGAYEYTGTAAVNKPPVAEAGADVNITLPVNSATLNGTSSADPDGSIASYVWTKVSGPTATIANANSGTAAIDNLIEGTYVFKLEVADDKGASAEDQMSVVVNAAPQPPPNVAPVAKAGTDITVTLPANTVTLDGTSSVDDDGTISFYMWKKISGPQATIVNSSAVTTIVNNLEEGTYLFQLTVIDTKGASSYDFIKVTISPAPIESNGLPVAIAGNDTTVTLPIKDLKLDAAGSYDPDGTISSYMWSVISGPPVDMLNINEPGIILNNLNEGIYVFKIEVTDDDDMSSSDTVQVLVNATPAQEPNSVESVKVFPNPVTHIFHLSIKNDSTGTSRYLIYDMHGRIVQRPEVFNKARGEHVEDINTSRLKSGLYMLEIIINSNTRSISKFIKL